MHEQTFKILFGTTSKAGSVPSFLNSAGAREFPASSLKQLEGDWFVTSFKLWDCYAQDWMSPYPVVLRMESQDALLSFDECGFHVRFAPVDVNARIVGEDCIQWREDPADLSLWGRQIADVDIAEGEVRLTFSD